MEFLIPISSQQNFVHIPRDTNPRERDKECLLAKRLLKN